LKALLSALFFLCTASSFAEDFRYYDVEIVVIENQTEAAKNAEHWPLEVSIEKPVNAVVLGEPPSTEWLPLDVDLAESFKVLGAEEYQLNEEVEKISQSRNQRVIFHAAWRQPGLDKKIAMPVYFKHDFTEIPLVQEEVLPEGEVLAADEILPTNNENIEAANASILEGVFRVTLARYLHLEAELSYRTKPAVAPITEEIYSEYLTENTEEKVEEQGVIYLKQKRNRIRSNELHYIDHPVLGILVKMTPYIKPEIDDTAPISATKAL